MAAETEGIFVAGAGTDKRTAGRIGDVIAEIYGLGGVAAVTLGEAEERPVRLWHAAEGKFVAGHSTGVAIMDNLAASQMLAIDGPTGVSMADLCLRTPNVLLGALIDGWNDPEMWLTGANRLARIAIEVALQSPEHYAAVSRLPKFDVADAARIHAEAGLACTVAVHTGDGYFPPVDDALEAASNAGATVVRLAGRHTDLLMYPERVVEAIHEAELAAKTYPIDPHPRIGRAA